ncbi:MAG: hypothetical protein JWR67_771 [Mucilaginibacter sp.]|nr:hypothetical protein [Mucilaginibacter sp.]MDB5109657.1 hypothetical protein [Mucilaginibacter sp.]
MPQEAELIFYYVDPSNTKYIEKYKTNCDFFLIYNINDVIGRPPLKYLGRVHNENIFSSEEEFVKLLAQGEEIRALLYNNSM